MKKRYRPVNNLSSQSIAKLQKTGNLKKYLKLKQPVDTITLIENVITCLVFAGQTSLTERGWSCHYRV